MLSALSLISRSGLRVAAWGMCGVWAACAGPMPQENEGRGPCEQAFAELHTLNTSLQEVTQSPHHVPSRSEFMKRCLSWPIQSQRCLSVSFHLSHKPACDSVWEQWSEADRKALWAPHNLPLKP
jgi:hypothetical protein